MGEYPPLPSMSRFCKEDKCIDEDCTLEKTRFSGNLLFTHQRLGEDKNLTHAINIEICEGSCFCVLSRVFGVQCTHGAVTRK